MRTIIKNIEHEYKYSAVQFHTDGIIFCKCNDDAVDINKINNKFIDIETIYKGKIQDIGKLKLEFDNLEVNVHNNVQVVVKYGGKYIPIKRYKKIIKRKLQA